jgi:geranylgeranyl pyrophosphate synthase
MADSWHSVVDKELASVDSLMRSEVRSAYPELNEMCEDMFRAGHHESRVSLCALSYYLSGGKDVDIVVPTAACFEAVFDGLNLHDRIDSSGSVVGAKKKLFSKGTSTTKVIVAGDFMYVMGFRLAYSRVPKVVPYLMRASASITDAIFAIVNRAHDPSITEDECRAIMEKKSIIEQCVIMECAAEQAGASEETIRTMSECGSLLGAVMQIRYDLEDLIGPKGQRASMNTMIAGYPTLPIYYAMQDPDAGQKIKDIFSKKDPSIKDLIQVAELIKSTDSFSKCRAIINDSLDRLREIVYGMKDSEYRAALLSFADDLAQ